MHIKRVLVNKSLSLSVAYLYNAMERGVSGKILKYRIVGVR